MAVVFISPKQRQKMFFMGITVMFLLFLVVISLGVFLSKPNEVSPVMVFNKPKVNIDMRFLIQTNLKIFSHFLQMETQYSYTATTKDNKSKTGFISAASADQARTILTRHGINCI